MKDYQEPLNCNPISVYPMSYLFHIYTHFVSNLVNNKLFVFRKKILHHFKKTSIFSFFILGLYISYTGMFVSSLYFIDFTICICINLCQ